MILAAVLAGVVLLGGGGGDARGLPGSLVNRPSATAAGDFIDVTGRRGARAAADETAATDAGARRWRSITAHGCTDRDGRVVPNIEDLCTGNPLVHVMLCDPADWTPPRWRSYLDPGATGWSPWEQVDYGTCPADRVPALTVEDFRRLPLPAPTLVLQPDRGWVLVNIETIVRTDPAPVVLTTELLGHRLEVEARPDTFTYDFGDGSEPLVTRDPGRPYPDFTTHHVYERPGEVTIALTTTWTGRYRLVGTEEWFDVAGTARTTTTSAPFTVEERTSRLVDGLCTDVPRPPDC